MGCPGRYGIEWRQSPRAAEHRAAALFLRINETHLPSNPAAQISVPAYKNDATRDCFYRKSRTLVQSFRAPRFYGASRRWRPACWYSSPQDESILLGDFHEQTVRGQR